MPHANRVAAGRKVSGHNTPKTCPQCSGSFLGTGKQRYCSRPCKEAAELADRSPRPCPHCGGVIDPAGKTGRRPVYCSAACKNLARFPAVARPCKVCGKSFTPARRRGKAVTCSPACGRIAASAAKLAGRVGTPEQQAAALAAELEKRNAGLQE